MAERGIPFSTEMVRAERAGRKTNTRRVITPSWARCLDLDDPEDRARAIEMCPHGKPGDRLYVREPLRPAPDEYGAGEFVTYDADESYATRDGVRAAWPWKTRYIASRYCPRWASRTMLEIVEVRVERVQDISADDAREEGLTRGDVNDHGGPVPAFRHLWDSINEGRGFGWNANPWVWVIAFRRIDE